MDRIGKDDAVLVNFEVWVSSASFKHPLSLGKLDSKIRDIQSIKGSGIERLSKPGQENRLHFAMVDFEVKLVFSFEFYSLEITTFQTAIYSPLPQVAKTVKPSPN
jgi:hypothetical protein